jgi:hypothetical protein
MQYSETQIDIDKIEAWGELNDDLLFLVPPEHRIELLRSAIRHEEAEIAEREKNGEGSFSVPLISPWIRQECGTGMRSCASRA